jgi:two-component system sensor histidine kinase BarA
MVDSLHRSGRNLAEVINDLIDYSGETENWERRTEEQSGRNHKELFALQELLVDCREVLASRLERGGAQFQVTVGPEAPEQMVANRRRLLLALLHMIDYGVRRAGSERLALEISGGKNEMVRFHLGTHCGHSNVSARVQSFEEENDDFEEGVGLVLCRRLVERMGGQMGCRCRSGPNVCCWFDIPQKSPLAPEEDFRS